MHPASRRHATLTASPPRGNPVSTLAFRRALGGLEWGIEHEPPRRRYVSQSKPVLKADGYDIDVLQVAYNLAMRTLDGRDTDDEALLRAYRARTAA